MSILKILTIPNPILKIPSASVDAITPDITRLIQNLAETLNHNPYCVGIAAPQTGNSLRIAIVDVSRSRKPQPNRGLIVLVNPVIVSREGRVSGREGCLSVPDFTGNVTRAEKVAVESLDALGREQRIEAAGFEAVALQHEIDHLDGFLFLDRVSSLKTDVFRRKGM